MVEPLELSQQALDRLHAEFDERTGPGRTEITNRIEEAREHGDLKENAEYHAAKNEQGLNEARIRQLEDMLSRAVVVEADANTDAAAAGLLVELRYEGDDDTTTYLMGSIEERHDTYDVLSVSSPLGRAVIGKHPGTKVSYQGPKRELAVELVSVRPAS
ncbi:MAG TPA: transcription elongation factor GreA [Acidimicrobiia bacterium]